MDGLGTPQTTDNDNELLWRVIAVPWHTRGMTNTPNESIKHVTSPHIEEIPKRRVPYHYRSLQALTH